jgi:hypothetical protein
MLCFLILVEHGLAAGMLWRAWLAPTPSPLLLHHEEPGWGGRGGAFNGPCPAWEFRVGGYSGDSNGRIKVELHSGNPMWRLKWADQSGASFWRPNVATLFGGPKWGAF